VRMRRLVGSWPLMLLPTLGPAAIWFLWAEIECHGFDSCPWGSDQAILRSLGNYFGPRLNSGRDFRPTGAEPLGGGGIWRGGRSCRRANHRGRGVLLRCWPALHRLRSASRAHVYGHLNSRLPLRSNTAGGTLRGIRSVSVHRRFDSQQRSSGLIAGICEMGHRSVSSK
jgi:hypothetical protein